MAFETRPLDTAHITMQHHHVSMYVRQKCWSTFLSTERVPMIPLPKSARDRTARSPEQDVIGRARGDGDEGSRGRLALRAERAELSHLGLPLRLRLRALLGLLAPMLSIRCVGPVEYVEPADVAVATVEPLVVEVVVVGLLVEAGDPR